MAGVYHGAGIRTLWDDSGLADGFHGPSPRATPTAQLHIALLTASMADRLRLDAGVLGCAVAFNQGGLAYIFYELITRLPYLSSAHAARALGRVMAHEVGHLLLRHHSHAKTGLMRAVWDLQDLRRDNDSALLFTTEQAALIRAAASTRFPNSVVAQ